jgi:putative tricarboxylic transport membrane protein
VTSDERLSQAPDVPTVKESGVDVTFANWRGFFGAPGLPEAKAQAYRDVLKKMYATPEWEDIRNKRGWQDLYKPGAEFTSFLEGQEKAIGEMMRELGFIQ